MPLPSVCCLKPLGFVNYKTEIWTQDCMIHFETHGLHNYSENTDIIYFIVKKKVQHYNFGHITHK